MLEVPPIKSSSSLGAAEQYARTLAGIVRTLRLSVEEREGVDVRASSLGFAMLVLHANWFHNRFQVKVNGLTPFEYQHQRAYRGKLFQWGQP
eukprot:12484430-Heterocapsa_arctica.AAC.1